VTKPCLAPTCLIPTFLALLVGACQPPVPQTPEARADAARFAACRERMDAIYAQQNRAEIYTDRMDMERDAQDSGYYIPAPGTRALGEQYGRDQQFAECLRQGSSTAPVAQ
jgi:hypothetical protein